jgi:predicted membrane chloride channel (bestrophin family)
MIIVIVDILLGLELISENIESPFGGTDERGCAIYDNTLDLDGISSKI